MVIVNSTFFGGILNIQQVSIYQLFKINSDPYCFIFPLPSQIIQILPIYMSGKKILYTALGEFKVTAQTVEKFARLVGDYNPVHLSQQAAAQTRFGRRIAHGMVAVSFAHSLIPQNYSYSALNIKFKRPVYLDDIVKVKLELIQPNELKIQISKLVIDQNKQPTNPVQETVTEATGTWVLEKNPQNEKKSNML